MIDDQGIGGATFTDTMLAVAAIEIGKDVVEGANDFGKLFQFSISVSIIWKHKHSS